MALIPQGTLATKVWEVTWNALVDAINALTSGVPASIVEFADGDTDPSVDAALATTMFRTANTGGTEITTFDDGADGQVITIIIDDANTTFINGATLKLPAGADLTPAQHDIIQFTLNSTVWCCSGYSQNSA